MKNRLLNIIILLLVTVGTATAQNGSLMRMSDFSPSDMLQMSQYNYGFGTARTAAMGGAFTSLGADLSSMSINPAGLGMFRGSEFGFSPSITINTTNNSRKGGLYTDNNNRTRFAMNNLGIALNLYQGTGTLTSFTLGFGYNKLVDFNSNSGVATPTDDQSIAEIFAQQLRGIPLNWIDKNSRPFDNYDIHPNEWGAVLGYKTGLIDAIDPNDNNNKLYGIGAIDPDASKSHYASFNTKGSIGEYSISGGMNFNNVFYLGFTLGIQDIYYNNVATYEEAYGNNNIDGNHLDFIQYTQGVKYTGSAVNFKLGGIIRPTEGLRIGFAVHTPSYVSLNREYKANMYTKFFDHSTGDMNSNNLIYDYDYSSPTRVLLGASYTFGNIAVLTADYERVWYNGMRVGSKASDANKEDFKSMIKNDYKAANNIRTGIEIKPLSMLALRAGYAYYGNVLSDKTNVFDSPVGYRSYNISAGLGYRSNRFSLDLAYIYNNTDYTTYDLFYYNGKNNAGQPITVASGDIESTRTRHTVTLSMGLRF